MNEKTKKHYYELAYHLKAYIDTYKYELPEGEKVLVPYYRKSHERIVKNIFYEVLGEDVSYCVFVRHRNKEIERIKREGYFLVGFLAYMLFAILFVMVSVIFDWEWRWAELVLYLGNVGGLICGYMVFNSAIRMKKIIFLLFSLFIFGINFYQIYRQLSDWGVFEWITF